MSEIFVVSFSVSGLPNFSTSDDARTTTHRDTTATAASTRDMLSNLTSVRISRPVSTVDGFPRVSGLKATGIFLLLTVVFTWPQAIHWLSVPDFMDTYFSMWRLAWIAHQLPLDPQHLFDANIFYPLKHTLAYSDAVLLEGLIGAPLLWAGVPAVVVY